MSTKPRPLRLLRWLRRFLQGEGTRAEDHGACPGIDGRTPSPSSGLRSMVGPVPSGDGSHRDGAADDFSETFTIAWNGFPASLAMSARCSALQLPALSCFRLSEGAHPTATQWVSVPALGRPASAVA